MEKMRFHILGMPHTKTVKYWATCAYTQKIIKLCSMLHSLGHEVYHYGVEGSEVDCTHDVVVMSSAKHDAHFGTDWHDNHTFNVSDTHHEEWYNTAAVELDKNLKSGIILLIKLNCSPSPISKSELSINTFVIGVPSSSKPTSCW